MAEPSLSNRDATAQEWSDSDFVLPVGMVGYENPTGRYKRGDGENVFDDLPWSDEATNENSSGGFVTQTQLLSALENVSPGSSEPLVVEDFDTAIKTGIYVYLAEETGLVPGPVNNAPVGLEFFVGSLQVSGFEVSTEVEGVPLTFPFVTQVLFGSTSVGSEIWIRTHGDGWTDWYQPSPDSVSGGTPSPE